MVTEKNQKLSLDADIEFFHFFPSPWRSPQEREAGLDAWIEFKAVDVDNTRKVFPPEMLHEFGYNHL